jgi:uncharacterized protein
VEGPHRVSSVAGYEELIERFFRVAHRLHVDRSNRLSIREFDQAYRLIGTSPHSYGNEFLNLNDQVRPFGIISVDCRGNISTFSPELLGQHAPAYSNFLFGNINEGLGSVLKDPAFLAAFDAIQPGVKSCASECEYFSYCGGGCPSNKYFENGRFDSTETLFCRTHVKIPFAIGLKALEDDVFGELTSAGSAGEDVDGS